ncbi:VWA domain-containing protein [Halobacteriaceae archaeon SHR40]|uniref:vWA domain-containing protein n=1 Tax=Halovenus amylolytica TaxID=2500550 RepID=UPI000FE3F6FA
MVDRRRYLELCAAGSSLALAGCLSNVDLGDSGGTEEDDPEKIDDWQYDPDESSLVPNTSHSPNMSSGSRSTTASADDAMESGDSIGLAAGGAADVGTFRRNVHEGYLPIPETMATEGLFHDYYFDTGGDGSCTSLFCPTYTPAVTEDPLSDETERYLSVGLDSGLATSEFDRPPLNLVIVLDISGSMGASFDEYYYDKFGNKQRIEGETDRPKIEVATDVLADLTEQLRPEDRLGVVLFNSDAEVAKPLRDVERTDMNAIREHIREDIEAGGGTNISAGMDEAEKLLDEVVEERTEYENRSILLTDAQINHGETEGEKLQSTLKDRAEKGMHTSVIGVGVDFNAELIDQLTAVRGANYYSVYSADQFEQRLVEEFEYMVTPLVYDLSLELNAEGYEIKQVYGSTAAEEATGELMYVNTLFPSPSEGDKAKGGVVLVEVEQTGSSDGEMELVASWERRSGLSESTTEQITFPEEKQWGNTAIRKAVLLARYADVLKEWTVTERPLPEAEVYPERSESGEEMGVEPPAAELTQWELQSKPLRLSPEMADRLAQFRSHFEREADAIGDETLDQELELLDEILAAE